MKKVLITGGSGFMGRRAAAYFTDLGYTVLAPSHAELDITEASSVQEWFQMHRPQAVIHCAAISDTGLCQKEPEKSARINVTGSTNLATACASIGAKFIFCSSDQVYAASPLPGPHRESEALTPGNIYAQQKLLAEQQCLSLCPDTVCLRLSWMYDSRFLPGEHGHLLTSLCSAIQDPDLPLSWPLYDHRGITDVNSVVSRLPAALDLPAGVYNFGAENDRSTYHTIHAVLTALEQFDALERLKPNLQAFADAPRDIRMDVSLANSMGITFDSTCEGLKKALANCLPPAQ